MGINTEIRCFLSSFKSKIKSIKETKYAGDDKYILSKILYVCVLDSLAKTVSKPTDKNRVKFVNLIENYSGWAYAKKISTPHLIKFIDIISNEELNNLKLFLTDKIKEWDTGSNITLDKDPDLKKIERLWPHEIPKKINKTTIKDLSHSNLFYQHRCKIIHEFEESGYGFEFDFHKEPLYRYRQDTKRKTQSWELIYPVNFYHKICLNTITNLGNYY